MNTYFNNRESCPACNSKNSITLLNVEYSDPKIKHFITSMYSSFNIEYAYLENGNYVLNECTKCALIYQKEIPSEFLVTKIYSEWLDVNTVSEFDDKTIETEKSIRHAKQIENVINYLDALPNELNFLDFGMGLGAWCRLARNFGCNVYGTDISEERMGYVESSGIEVVSFEDIQNHQFDFINANQVFEHIAEPLEILLHLGEALKQNGIIKIAVPDGWDIKRRLDVWELGNPDISEGAINPFLEKSENSLNPVSPFEHINCFDYDTLVTMAEKARLTPVLIPNIQSDVYSVKHWSKKSVRAFLRKYYYLLIGGKKVREGTNLFFAKQ